MKKSIQLITLIALLANPTSISCMLKQKTKKDEIVKKITKEFYKLGKKKYLRKLFLILANPSDSETLQEAIEEKMKKFFNTQSFYAYADDFPKRKVALKMQNLCKIILGPKTKKIGALYGTYLTDFQKICLLRELEWHHEEKNLLVVLFDKKVHPKIAEKEIFEIIDCNKFETKDEKLSKKGFNTRVSYLVKNLL